MTREVHLKLPVPQNFIILQVPGLGLKLNQNPLGSTQLPDEPKIPIEDLSELEAEQYAEELKQQFLSHYRHRKAQPKQSVFNR